MADFTACLSVLKVLVRKHAERDYLEDLSIDTRTILKLILNKSFWMAWSGFISLGIGTVGGLL